MKTFLRCALLLLLFAYACFGDEPAARFSGTVKQKIKEGLIVDDLIKFASDPGKVPNNHILLVGYPKEADVVDEDSISFFAVRDGQFTWGSETLAKWRAVPKK